MHARMFASSFGEAAIRRSLSGTSAARCTSSEAPFPCTVMPSSARESRSHTVRLLSMIVTSCPSADTSCAMAKPTFPPPTITIFIEGSFFSQKRFAPCIAECGKRSITSGEVDGNRFPPCLTAALCIAESFGKNIFHRFIKDALQIPSYLLHGARAILPPALSQQLNCNTGFSIRHLLFFPSWHIHCNPTKILENNNFLLDRML